MEIHSDEIISTEALPTSEEKALCSQCGARRLEDGLSSPSSVSFAVRYTKNQNNKFISSANWSGESAEICDECIKPLAEAINQFVRAILQRK